MGYSATAIVLVAVLLGVCKAAITMSGQPGVNCHILGTVEGRTYLADNKTRRTWNASKEFCESLGMRLATVTTEEQQNFLDGINDPQFRSTYWTDGRDALLPQQSTWDDDDLPLSKNLHKIYMFNEAYTCVGYNSYVQTEDKWYSSPCAMTFGTLCEFYNVCK